MSSAPLPVRLLVAGALALLMLTLGDQWISGRSPGNFPGILLSAVMLNLAFAWEGLAKMIRNQVLGGS